MRTILGHVSIIGANKTHNPAQNRLSHFFACIETLSTLIYLSKTFECHKRRKVDKILFEPSP